jgi:hypothetical protein
VSPLGATLFYSYDEPRRYVVLMPLYTSLTGQGLCRILDVDFR